MRKIEWDIFDDLDMSMNDKECRVYRLLDEASDEYVICSHPDANGFIKVLDWGNRTYYIDKNNMLRRGNKPHSRYVTYGETNWDHFGSVNFKVRVRICALVVEPIDRYDYEKYEDCFAYVYKYHDGMYAFYVQDAFNRLKIQ